MDAFKLLEEILKAKGRSVCEIDLNSDGKRMRVFVVDQTKKTIASPVTKRVRESPVIASVSNGASNGATSSSGNGPVVNGNGATVKKQKTETGARFKLTPARVDLLNALFDAHKKKTDSAAFNFTDFIEPEETKKALKEFYDHYDNVEDGARKFKSAILNWAGKYKKGELVFTPRGKPKQTAAGNSSDDDV